MRVGAVDIGTNAARLLVADVAQGTVRQVERRVVITGLGWDVDRRRAFGEDNMVRALGILAGYRDALDGAERAMAVATSASRDADNRDVFFDRVEAVLGVRPVLLSGDEEAVLSFRGATLGRSGTCLVIDPGGGSTEFVFGAGRPEYAVSIDMGSIRLTERALPSRPATGAELAAAETEVRAAFVSVQPGIPDTVLGLGGTFHELARMAGEDPVTLERLDRLVVDLARLTVEETAAILLDPARAPVILSGAVIATEAVRLAGTGLVEVTERDILDGVALRIAESA